MANANSTSPRTSKRNAKPAEPTADVAPADLPEINALSIDYSRFSADEIADFHIRYPLNRAHAALAGIRTIGKILYANEIEKQANSGEMSLPAVMQADLFQALIVLSDQGYTDADAIGERLVRVAKGGA